MAVACRASRILEAGWRFLRGAALAALALVLPATLHAQPGPRGVAAADAKGRVEVPPGPLLAVVSLSRQQILVYGSTGLLVQSPVSTGMAGHRTPSGVFSILQRSRHHRSNIYSDAPMPYMQRLTWSGIALHGGVVPGYPASHGCIRLPHHFASELWRMTRLGTRVVVVPDDPTASAIEHARLPAPRLTPADKGPELASAGGGTVSDAGAGSPKLRLLDPLERVRAMKGFVVADFAAKTKAARLAVETAAAKSAEANRAAADLRTAEAALETARRRYQWAVKAAEAPNATERAKEADAAAEADLATAERKAEQARLLGAVADDRAAAAAAAVVETENARHEADAALKASRRAEEPISVLVSRKAGRVSIRQAWMPIHEAHVVFTENGRPFGTHVYMAMGPAADGETMHWVSVSLPPDAPEPPRRSRGRAPEPAPPSGPQETAASVLERFELPAATRRFIEDRLWAGATLIVSDHAASRETAPLGTDFVVLTR
jgi:hypothetical protein